MSTPSYRLNWQENEQGAWPEPPHVLLSRLISRVETVMLGKHEVVLSVLTALLAGGHVLLEDRPGVGKTMLAHAFARVLGGDYRRIQFTSDLLPADVTGGQVWDSRHSEFVYRPGPIMANLVLADEINRTSPRTQSALLEAMEERKVTIDGETRSLPEPFMLIATQNPLSYEGTNALPEAQLDRFMMRLSIGYPDAEQEGRMLDKYASGQRMDPESLRPVVHPNEWLRMQQEARGAHVHPDLISYIVRIIGATRSTPDLLLGGSPRASRDWLRAASARSYIEGRSYVLPDDLRATASAVISHRLIARGGAHHGGAAEAVLQRIMRETPMPAGAVTSAAAGSASGRRRPL
ncbi:AAA family ATPase [Paenibacillus sp. GCM10023252]|uniref:AAA family ATPase n=1 Tax=Paenibacillus sp. GCM10023252 TaxID=3252649 RepID=UPI0036172087